MTIKKIKYNLTFDGASYLVERADGVEAYLHKAGLNTRSITTAKKWMKEWLNEDGA